LVWINDEDDQAVNDLQAGDKQPQLLDSALCPLALRLLNRV